MLAPINLYFDVTPTGNILTKFSQDLMFMDNQIFDTIRSASFRCWVLIQVLFVIANANWYVLLLVPVLLLIARTLF